MYEFLATFENLATCNEVTQKITIDMLPLGPEDLDFAPGKHFSPDAYAWMCATEKALSSFPESSPFALSSLELIACS